MSVGRERRRRPTLGDGRRDVRIATRAPGDERWATRSPRPPAARAALLAGAAPALAAAGVTVFLSFKAGGYFPGTTALVVVGLGLLLVVRTTLHPRPLAGLSVGYVVAVCALGLLAVWTLISSTWSDAPARAIVEYDRVLLYLLAFVAFGAMGRTADRLRWMVRAVAAAAFVVCLCALITRLAPDVWEISSTVANDRLNYPVTYWNALGLLAAIGIVLCLALTSDDREAPVGRLAAAGALPVLAVTLILTFSRGSIVVAAVGCVVLILVGRPRLLLSGLLAAGPGATVAVVAAYRADLLATDTPTTAAATAQGHNVALVLVLCVGLALATRAALLMVDQRVARARLPALLYHPASWAAALGVAIVVGLAIGAPSNIDRQYQRFVNGDPVNGADLRSRLTRPGDNGRLVQWGVAIDGFEAAPIHGEGAGTYALAWDRRGSTSNLQVEDAHSLYIETLGELGLVGLLLVLTALMVVLGGFAARARGPDRVVGGALFAAGLAWALSAGVDWMWELPAVSFWVFAAGGMAVAGRVPSGHSAEAGARTIVRRPLRVAVGAGCLVLLIVPARVYLSESPLRESAKAFARDDCATALDRALDSSGALGVRSEPYVLIGYCDVRLGRPALAVRALANAVRRDPDNWEAHYGLALVRGAAGLDPRPAARIARRLKPRDPLPVAALQLFDTEDPRKWRRRALGARLPTE